MSMTKEIVYTDKYALILSDEQIKDARSHWRKWHLEDNSIINQFPTYLTDLTQCKLIIAHLPLSDAPMLEGVPLLPPLPQGEDVKELAENNPEGYHESDYQKIFVEGFIVGYNKAKEKYKYTQEDIMNLVQRSHEIYNDGLGVATDSKLLMIIDFIESLQQQRPTHFECEMENKIAIDGHTIIGSEPKTTTNSQGQIELVGKYI